MAVALVVGGLALIGDMGLLQRVLLIGALPVGVIGAWRFMRPVESTRARLVATVVYTSIWSVWIRMSPNCRSTKPVAR